MNKEIDYKKQTDFILGSELTTRGNSGLSRAMVKDDDNKLVLNYKNDFTGGVVIGSNTKVNGIVDAKGFTLNGSPLVGPKGDSGSITETDKKNLLWCADGKLCQLPGTSGSGIKWGYGGSSIVDDGDLRIKSDDNIIISTGTQEIAKFSPSGFSIGNGMGPYYIRIGDGDSYLDSKQIDDNNNGTHAFVNGELNQQWMYEPFVKQLRSVRNNKCLATDGDKTVLKDCGSNDESQIVTILEDNKLKVGDHCFNRRDNKRASNCNESHVTMKAVFRKV